MCGTNVRMPWITPHRLTPNTHSQSARVCSQIGRLQTTPALLQRIWTAPKVSSVCAARSSTSEAFETSVLTARTVAPLALKSASSLTNRSFSTSARTTFMPSAANRSASPLPMPLAAPVITATFCMTFVSPQSKIKK